MWLDTEAKRLDVARILRQARARGASAVRWESTRIEVRDDDTLVIAGRAVIELERQIVRPPTTGKAVEGPALARCPRPGCERRARVLWAPPWDETDVACRACSQVRYASAATSDEAERARLAFDRLRARLGLTGTIPMLHRRYRQHATTYDRTARRLNEARARFEETTSDVIARALGRPLDRDDVEAKTREMVAAVGRRKAK